jgi:hypothetical protein
MCSESSRRRKGRISRQDNHGRSTANVIGEQEVFANLVCSINGHDACLGAPVGEVIGGLDQIYLGRKQALTAEGSLMMYASCVCCGRVRHE